MQVAVWGPILMYLLIDEESAWIADRFRSLRQIHGPRLVAGSLLT